MQHFSNFSSSCWIEASRTFPAPFSEEFDGLLYMGEYLCVYFLEE